MATDIIARGLATSNSGGGGSGTSVDVQAGTGISFSGTDPVIINNNGVTDVQPGTNNGTVKVVIAGKESKSKEVSVKGLSNAAYKDIDTAIDETTKDSENLPTTKAVKESLDKKIDTGKLGETNGVATLDENKKLKSAQLPSHNHGSNEVNTMMGYSKPSTLTDKAIKNTDTLNDAIGKLEKNLDDKMDNGNYAGSSSKGGSATSAEKLTNTEQIGTSTKPVYFSADGVPVAIDYKLEKDVPSTAKLTDTTYSAGTGLRIDSTDNNKIHNMGVLSVNESATNGSIDITIGKNGAETSETKSISIHGLSNAAYKDVDKAFGVPTLDANVKISVNQIPTTDNYNVDSAYPVTSKAVKAAIDTLPNPMVFKGSLGVGGTITALPTAESGNEGFTYKVITNGEYVGQTAKIGDLFISDGLSWIYIPSADEPDGTVTSVGISVPTGLKVNDGTSPITTSGTIEVELDEGYVIPKSADIVPSTRKVNEKVLSADIVLNGADIKADGYTKPKSASAIEETDTVNQAFGKLEYKTDTNATNISKNKTNILTLAKHMTGDLTDSDFQEDSTVAMTKTVPSGMGDYAAIKVIGGKTVKDEENQILKNAVVESVVSISKNLFNNTPIRLINTKKESNYVWTNIIADTRERIIPHMVFYKGSSVTKEATLNVHNNTYYSTFTKTDNADSMTIGHTGSANDIKISLDISMLNDETDYTVSFTMIGSPNVIGSIKISNVMIEKSSIVTRYSIPFKTTLSIPDSDRNLPCFGYGISETLQNVRDYENGTYTQTVAEVDLGDLTWNKSESYQNTFIASIVEIQMGSLNEIGNILCSKYVTESFDKVVYSELDKTIALGTAHNIAVTDKSYADVTAFKEAMKGVKLVYELETPVVIDISDMLMPIHCEAGGTLTFTNEHNLDMPNTVIYKKEVSLS